MCFNEQNPQSGMGAMQPPAQPGAAPAQPNFLQALQRMQQPAGGQAQPIQNPAQQGDVTDLGRIRAMQNLSSDSQAAAGPAAAPLAGSLQAPQVAVPQSKGPVGPGQVVGKPQGQGQGGSLASAGMKIMSLMAL